MIHWICYVVGMLRILASEVEDLEDGEERTLRAAEGVGPYDREEAAA